MAHNFLTGLESKRDLVINQVPITTKPEVDEVLPKSLLRRVIVPEIISASYLPFQLASSAANGSRPIGPIFSA